MKKELKQEIDNLPYEKMLSLWRHATSGHKYFIGETGKYFAKVLNEKSKKFTHVERVNISKKIGW